MGEPSFKPTQPPTETVRSTLSGIVCTIDMDRDSGDCVVWVLSDAGNAIPFGPLISVSVSIKTHVFEGTLLGRRLKNTPPTAPVTADLSPEPPPLPHGGVLDDASAGLILGRLLGLPGTEGLLTMHIKPLVAIED